MLFCDILRNKTIFVAALDWGLGHATRCVSLIKILSENNKIILGVTPTTRQIFDKEFPETPKVEIEPYHIRYSATLPVLMKLLTQVPRLLSVIKKEHVQLKRIVRDYNIDVVVSDNRPGLHHPSVECIYLTHQLNIKAGVFSWIANGIHNYYIGKFDSVWVPDFKEPEQSLAGELSRSSKFPEAVYIGPLSRLTKNPKPYETNFKYLILLSGPEPLRTVLEKKLLRKARKSQMPICLVRGKNEPLKNCPNNVSVYSLPDALQIARLIESSETVICRSGYSTLMDLYTTGKRNIVLVPTPGQSEQIYLAKYWADKFNCRVIHESDLSGFDY